MKKILFAAGLLFLGMSLISLATATGVSATNPNSWPKNAFEKPEKSKQPPEPSKQKSKKSGPEKKSSKDSK